MPPEPLSEFAPKASIMLAGIGARYLTRHPALGLLAVEAIASWSRVEGFMLNLFIELFGGDGALAATVFLALEADGPKGAAIRAAAEKLDGDKRNLLSAILAIAKTNKKARDKLCHWLWGESPNLPDALLLVDPRSTIGMDLDRSKVYVYREQDFLAIINANDRLAAYGGEFMFLIADPETTKDSPVFVQLSEVPEIRERLDHLNRKA
jgi:hypothetical protein